MNRDNKSLEDRDKPSFYGCFLCGITGTQAKRRGVGFHRFPKSPDVRADWEAFCGRPGGKILCSGHFSTECYPDEVPGRARQRTKLMKDSVPTIRDPWGQNQPKMVSGKANVIEPVKAVEADRNCFLCRKMTKYHDPIVENIQPIPSKSIESDLESHRGTVIAKYFSFELKDMTSEVVCLWCWSMVKEFHLFRAEIEAIHTDPFTYIPVERKVDEEEGQVGEKTEPKTNNQIKLGNKDFHEVELDTNSEIPPKKKRKTSHKFDILIAQNCDLVCHMCSKRFEKFGLLQTHCKDVHQVEGRVTCCNKYFIVRARLVDHLHSHDSSKLLTQKLHGQSGKQYAHEGNATVSV